MADIEMQPGAGEPDAAQVNTGKAVQVYIDPLAPLAAPEPARPPLLLIGLLGIAAAAGVGVVGLNHYKSSADAPAAFQDLGAGISNATGLRGSLKARWLGTSAQYQLEIDPIDPLQSAGFSFVVANPPQPLLLHMKLLDATGYEVCGKDVLLPFSPSSPAEAARERGQDLLQTTVDDTGKIISMSAQGTLPCTPEQYKQVVYWDFSTNFPALEEQEQLMNHASAARIRQENQERVLRARNAPPSTFFLEGDEYALQYDPSRNVLEGRLGRRFQVTGSAQEATASLWVDNGVLFHYKCDQRAHCMLASAGSGQSLSVTALQ